MQQIIYLVHAYHVPCNTMVILLWSVWSFGTFGWYVVFINVCYYPSQIERSLSGNAGWVSNAYIRSYSWASQCHVHQPRVTGWICFVISVVMLTFLTNISIWLLIRKKPNHKKAPWLMHFIFPHFLFLLQGWSNGWNCKKWKLILVGLHPYIKTAANFWPFKILKDWWMWPSQWCFLLCEDSCTAVIFWNVD